MVPRAMGDPRRDPTDRISPLPDDVIYHILSFLDVFDAVRLGMLSTRWERLCRAIPVLNIDIPMFCNRRNLIVTLDLCEYFKDFVNWVLLSRASTNITRFRLRCDDLFTAKQVFSWISAVASRNVQELILTFNPYQNFYMPISLVKGQSLQFMELCLFGHVLQLSAYVGFFPHLKCLSLNRIKFNDEDLTRSFFSGCPSLEKLVLSHCTFEDIKVLDISSFSIEHLLVEDDPEGVGYDNMDFKICCPKLLFFKYEAPSPRRYILDRVSSLEIIHFLPWNIHDDLAFKGHVSYFLGVLKLVPNVVDLKLGIDIITGLCKSFDELRCNICTFHGLKALNLWVTLYDDKMRFLGLMLEHSPKLEALTLYIDPEENDEDLKFPDLSTISCLKNSVHTIQLIGFGCTINEIELARILLRCGLVLKRFVLYPTDDAE